MRIVLRIVAILIIAGPVIAVTYVDRRPTRTDPTTRSGPTKTVVTEPVKASNHVRTIRFSGVTRSVRRAKLSFTVGERLLERPVEVGDRVERGEIVGKLDDRAFVNAVDGAEARVAELDARIEQVERDHQRMERLVAADASATVELERTVEKRLVLVAGRDRAHAQVREARRTLKEAILRAPFAGTVTDVFLEPGEFATPGAPVVAVSGEKEIEIEVEVPESVMSKLAAGMDVKVDLPLSGRAGLEGRISYMGVSALGPGQLFPVLIALDPSDDVAAGTAAEVTFEIPAGSAKTAPLAAVINPGGQTPQVFVVRDGRARKVSVEVESIVGDQALLRGSLEEGEPVVSGGHLGLLSGDRVEVVTHAAR